MSNNNIVITRKKKKSPKKNTPKAASPPEDPKTPEWKEKARKANKKPKQLKIQDTWGQHKQRKREPRRKGIKILVYGDAKCGKTHFAQSAVNFDGITGIKREIPCGYPVMVLDTEEESAMEIAEQDFWEELLENTIMVEQAVVENEETGKIDKLKSMIKLEEWVHSTSQLTQGTLVIDTITDYDDWLYNVLITQVLGKKYGFNKIGVENKKPTPIEWKWKRRQYVEFIRDLRRTKLNVVIVGQSKPEYDGEGFDAAPTGAMLVDSDKKTPHWVDIVCLMTRENDETGSYRKLEVVMSRYENKEIENIVLEDDVSFSALIEAIAEKL